MAKGSERSLDSMRRVNGKLWKKKKKKRNHKIPDPPSSRPKIKKKTEKKVKYMHRPPSRLVCSSLVGIVKNRQGKKGPPPQPPPNPVPRRKESLRFDLIFDVRLGLVLLSMAHRFASVDDGSKRKRSGRRSLYRERKGGVVM